MWRALVKPCARCTTLGGFTCLTSGISKNSKRELCSGHSNLHGSEREAGREVMDDAFQHLLYQNYIIADCITIQESRGYPKQTSDLATTTAFHREERHSTETC